MVSSDSTVMVSNRNYEYHEVAITDVINNVKNYYAVSLNNRSNVYSCVPIELGSTYIYSGTMYKLQLENNCGQVYNLTVKPNCGFITKRGIVNAMKLNELDVVIDQTDCLCKIVGKENITVENMSLSELSIQYTYNYFCNGILIKGKI